MKLPSRAGQTWLIEGRAYLVLDSYGWSGGEGEAACYFDYRYHQVLELESGQLDVVAEKAHRAWEEEQSLDARVLLNTEWTLARQRLT